MHLGLLRITLHVPAARSLKDRRGVVRRAVDRVKARFNVSVAEVGDSDHWQRATIAVSVVSGDKGVVEDVLSKCTSVIATAGDAVITRRELDVLAYSDTEAFGEQDLLGESPGAWDDDDGQEQDR